MKRFFYALLLLSIPIFLGCTGPGDMRMVPLPANSTYTIGGQIILTDPVESDLLLSIRGIAESIGPFTDFSKFLVTVGGKSSNASKIGEFSLSGVSPADDLLIKAAANREVLLRHVYVKDLNEIDV